MRLVLLCLDRGVPLEGAKGCSVHLRAVAASLVRAGHRVEVWVPDSGSAASVTGSAQSSFGVRRVPWPVTAEQLERELVHQKPELVIERLALHAPQGAVAASRTGVPHLYEVNAPLDQEANMYRGLSSPETAREDFRIGFAASGGAVAVSKEVADWVRALASPDYPIEVVPNGADPRFFEDPAADCVTRMRATLGWRAGFFHVGFVGSFKPWHGLCDLVDATARLGRDVPTQLVLVGEGPERARMIAAAERAALPVATIGMVAHEDVPACMALCDVMAVPAASGDAYFSPLKLAEAMAAAKPVVAVATGPSRRMVRHGEDGLLVPAGDPRTMAAALTRLARDPALRERLGRAARVTAGGWTWNHVAARVMAFASRMSLEPGARAVVPAPAGIAGHRDPSPIPQSSAGGGQD